MILPTKICSRFRRISVAKRMRAGASQALLCSLLTIPAQAVVVLVDGPNHTAPSGQPFFENVTSLGGGSAIYLGNRWVMTATHVAGSLPASVNFGGTSYSTQAGTYQKLTNNGTSGMSTTTDIALFRLTNNPGLPTVNLASVAPVTGTEVMMIGGGRVQQSSPTYWQVTVNPETSKLVWTEVAQIAGYNFVGYQTTSTKQVSWGLNQIENPSVTVNAGFGDVRSFSTNFSNPAPTADEAQAVVGDSGGAVFSLDGSNWVLSGMMHAVDGYENQPAYTAIPGQSTYAADLSFYNSQIVSITGIPEPGTFACVVFGACAPLLRRRRAKVS